MKNWAILEIETGWLKGGLTPILGAIIVIYDTLPVPSLNLIEMLFEIVCWTFCTSSSIGMCMHMCVIFFVLLGTPGTSLKLPLNPKGMAQLSLVKNTDKQLLLMFLKVRLKVHHSGSFKPIRTNSLPSDVP